MQKIYYSIFLAAMVFLSSIILVQTTAWAADVQEGESRIVSITNELKGTDRGARSFNAQLAILFDELGMQEKTLKSISVTENNINLWRKNAAIRYIENVVLPRMKIENNIETFNMLIHVLHEEMGLATLTYKDLGLTESPEISAMRANVLMRK